MTRTVAITGIFCAFIWLAGCGTGNQESGSQAEVQEQAAVQDTAPAEEPFDLMEYSMLDTNSGVFYGEYDEKVNDEITVNVGLEVTLLDGKITGITLKDTTWVHPRAAQMIPKRIIEEQKLPVDAVSGASVASWAIMTATALALEIDLMVLEDVNAEEDSLEMEISGDEDSEN